MYFLPPLFLHKRDVGEILAPNIKSNERVSRTLLREDFERRFLRRKFLTFYTSAPSKREVRFIEIQLKHSKIDALKYAVIRFWHMPSRNHHCGQDWHFQHPERFLRGPLRPTHFPTTGSWQPPRCYVARFVFFRMSHTSNLKVWSLSSCFFKLLAWIGNSFILLW